MSRSSMRNVLWISAALLLCGVLHALVRGDFGDSFVQLFTGSAVIVWSVSVVKRVTDRRLRALLLAVGVDLLLFLLCQQVNYRLAQDVPNLRRWAWYGYYFTEMTAAELVYLGALSIYRDPGERPRPSRLLPLPVGGLLTLALLTNDLHSLAFRFTTEARLPGSPKAYGPVYWLFLACFCLLMLTAFLIVLRKTRLTRRKRLRLPPLLPMAFLAVFLVLDLADRAPRLQGVKLWEQGEVFSYCLLAFLESCIGVGLIPANTDYEKFFSLAGLPVVILNEKGEVQYASAPGSYPFPAGEDTLVMSSPISGGRVEWAVDVAPLRALNRELSETVERIEARNAYLSAEARIRAERSEAETRNRIYDDITRIVRPQLESINARLEETGRPFDARLREIAVLSAYIKRRSNIELLSGDGGVPLEELELALRESLSYTGLCGVRGAVNVAGSGVYPAAMAAAAYESFETVLEGCLDGLRALLVSLRGESGALTLRLMLSGGEARLPPPGTESREGFSGSVSVTEDGQDRLVVLRFWEGGGAE